VKQGQQLAAQPGSKVLIPHHRVATILSLMSGPELGTWTDSAARDVYASWKEQAELTTLGSAWVLQGPGDSRQAESSTAGYRWP
jgi:hypothetical protein